MNLYGGQSLSTSAICDLPHTILLLNVLVLLPHYLSFMNLQVNNIHGMTDDNEICWSDSGGSILNTLTSFDKPLSHWMWNFDMAETQRCPFLSL